MINKFKTFAIAMLVAGATATATRASAAAPVTTTNTQIIENISLALTAYYEGVPSSKSLSDKTVSITTSDLLGVLSSVTGVTFTGKGATAPKLVYRTAYDQLESVLTTEVSASNTITLTNGTNFYLVTTNSTNALPITSTNGSNYYSYVITNGIVSQITNALPITTNAVPLGTNESFAVLSTNTILIGTTNTSTNVAVTLSTNSDFWTTIVPTIITNGEGSTNVEFLTYEATNSNEPVFTNVTQAFGVLYGGTNFVNVSAYISEAEVTNANSAFTPVVVVETGAGLGTTNATVATKTKTDIRSFSVAAVGTGSNNLVLDLQGIVTDILKYDTLTVHGTKTNTVIEPTSTSVTFSDLTGIGYIGGTFATNTVSTNDPGTNAYTILPDEIPYYGYVGTNTSTLYVGGNTNLGTNYGFLVNPTPVVVKGTITVTYLENLP